jgi:hypothetical protein
MVEREPSEPDLIRADQYALGITLYELLQRGELPSKLAALPAGPQSPADYAEIKRIHAAGIYEPLRIPEHHTTPESVNEVLRKMVDPDPHQRYDHLGRCVIDLRYAVLKDGLLRA